jgi:hypothetical protein
VGESQILYACLVNIIKNNVFEIHFLGKATTGSYLYDKHAVLELSYGNTFVVLDRI